MADTNLSPPKTGFPSIHPLSIICPLHCIAATLSLMSHWCQCSSPSSRTKCLRFCSEFDKNKIFKFWGQISFISAIFQSALNKSKISFNSKTELPLRAPSGEWPFCKGGDYSEEEALDNDGYRYNIDENDDVEKDNYVDFRFYICVWEFAILVTNKWRTLMCEFQGRTVGADDQLWVGGGSMRGRGGLG